MALDDPLLALAAPELETLVVLVVVDVELLLPPLVAPPVVVLPPELDETLVVADVPVALTEPLLLVPEELLEELAPVLLEAVVSANVGVATSKAMTPAAALARRGSSAFLVILFRLAGAFSPLGLGFFD